MASPCPAPTMVPPSLVNPLSTPPARRTGLMPPVPLLQKLAQCHLSCWPAKVLLHPKEQAKPLMLLSGICPPPLLADTRSSPSRLGPWTSHANANGCSEDSKPPLMAGKLSGLSKVKEQLSLRWSVIPGHKSGTWPHAEEANGNPPRCPSAILGNRVAKCMQ